MIDHVSVLVRDLAASAAFYEKLLAPLGLEPLVDRDWTIGFGKKYPEFWINHRPEMAGTPNDTRNHICLRASSREAVDKFHAARFWKGAETMAPVLPRRASITIYYGAFIRDPAGNTIEVVTFPRD